MRSCILFPRGGQHCLIALLNARQKKGQSQEHMTFARYFQEFLVEEGVLKIAEILPDSVILYMDHDRIARLADTSGK